MIISTIISIIIIIIIIIVIIIVIVIFTFNPVLAYCIFVVDRSFDSRSCFTLALDGIELLSCVHLLLLLQAFILYENQRFWDEWNVRKDQINYSVISTNKIQGIKIQQPKKRSEQSSNSKEQTSKQGKQGTHKEPSKEANEWASKVSHVFLQLKADVLQARSSYSCEFQVVASTKHEAGPSWCKSPHTAVRLHMNLLHLVELRSFLWGEYVAPEVSEWWVPA